MSDKLDIPDFLRGSRPGPKPRRTTPWRMPKIERPEGAKWESAERWAVYLDHHTCPQTDEASKGTPRVGYRYVWVIPGKTWTEVRDAEGYIKISTKDWNRIAAKGRQVS